MPRRGSTEEEPTSSTDFASTSIEKKYIPPNPSVSASRFVNLDLRFRRVQFPGGAVDAPPLLDYLYQKTEAFDNYCRQQALGGKSGLFRLLYDAEVVTNHHENHLGVLLETSAQAVIRFPDGEVLFAFLPYGGLPIMDALLEEAEGSLAQNVHLAWISGTLGTETGQAIVRHDLSPELLNPSATVVVPDDVVDSVVSLLRIPELRLANQSEREGRKVSDLIKRLQQYRGEANSRRSFSDPGFAPLYAEAARVFHQAGVVVAPLYCKNEPFLNAITQEAKETGDSDRWGYMQTAVLKPVVLVAENEWIVGGKDGRRFGMLDTSFTGAELLKYIPTNSCTEWRELGFDQAYFRLLADLEPLFGLRVGANEAIASQFARWLISN